jgi:hypothetical protein
MPYTRTDLLKSKWYMYHKLQQSDLGQGATRIIVFKVPPIVNLWCDFFVISVCVCCCSNERMKLK